MFYRSVRIASIFLLAAALLFAALLVWPLPHAPQVGLSGSFLIQGVSIVDVESGRLIKQQSVLVRAGRIASIGPEGSIALDGSPNIVDGHGKFLIPGLWDMHTHSTKLAPVHQHPLFIANGVTGVRDMWGCMNEPDSFFGCIEDRRRWNSATASGVGLSPRYIGQSSFQINGGNEVPNGFPDSF